MNRLPFIDSPDSHAIMTYLWRETRRGRFPQAFARMWEDSLLGQDRLSAIGTEIEAIMTGGGGPRTKGSRLGRRAVRLAAECAYGHNGPDERHPQHCLIGSIFHLSERQLDWQRWDASRQWGIIPGYIAGAAAVALASGVPPEHLAEYSESLAKAAFLATKADKVPASITDAEDTLIYGMTRFGPITDWVVPEEVKRMRPRMREKLERLAIVAAR